MVKNRCDHYGHRTLKLSVSYNKQMELADFLHAGTNLEKLKVDSMIFECAWSKNHLLVCETLKSAALIYELSCFLKADSDAIIFGLTYFLTFQCWGSTAVVFVTNPLKPCLVIFSRRIL